MMGIETIREWNWAATGRAKRHGERPYVPTAAQLVAHECGQLDAPGARIPDLGDYVPRGWVLVDRHFVGEPALTQDQFARIIARAPFGHGFAVIEAVEFQAWVGQYRPTKKRGDV